jgi:hypothetical protein
MNVLEVVELSIQIERLNARDRELQQQLEKMSANYNQRLERLEKGAALKSPHQAGPGPNAPMWQRSCGIQMEEATQ